MDLKDKASQLAVQIESIISHKKLRSGDPLLSETQLMYKYATSRSTVRRALGLLESQGIVTKRHGKGTFVADGFTLRKLKSQHETFVAPKDIAIVLQTVNDHYFGGIADACERVLKKNGHRTFIITAESLGDYLHHIEEKRIDGAIVSLPDLNYTIDLPRISPRIVLVNEGSLEGWDQVCSDDKQGAFMVTSYLISLGHRKIIHISGPRETYTGCMRIAGYEEAMNQNQLYSEIEIVETNYTRQDACSKMKAILKQEKPDAVICGNDQIAEGVYRAAQEFRLRIPDDLSVTGYGNQAEGMQLIPPLTTVDQGTEAIGLTAARLLLASLNGDNSKTETVKIPVTMIFRNSCKSR